jgi:hypothetical protein
MFGRLPSQRSSTHNATACVSDPFSDREELDKLDGR